MKVYLVIIGVCFVSQSVSAPTKRTSKDLWFVPGTRYVPVFTYHTAMGGQVRGPLDFIGNWIQSSEWFPIEVNVPDSVSSVGNFAQNVGTGFNTFTQNVGNGFTNFAQNVGNGIRNITQRIPLLGGLNRPPMRFYFVMPVESNSIKYIKEQIPFEPFTGEFPAFP